MLVDLLRFFLSFVAYNSTIRLVDTMNETEETLVASISPIISFEPRHLKISVTSCPRMASWLHSTPSNQTLSLRPSTSSCTTSIQEPNRSQNFSPSDQSVPLWSSLLRLIKPGNAVRGHCIRDAP